MLDTIPKPKNIDALIACIKTGYSWPLQTYTSKKKHSGVFSSGCIKFNLKRETSP